MRIAPSGHEDELELNIIPLVDVMLVLLMFFVLTTTFEQQTRLKVELPQASADSASELDEGLVVAVDREGRFYVGDNEVLNPGLEALKDAIVRSVGDRRDGRVLLRADATAQHQYVVTAMDALGQLGFSDVGIATVRQDASDQ